MGQAPAGYPENNPRYALSFPAGHHPAITLVTSKTRRGRQRAAGQTGHGCTRVDQQETRYRLP